VNFDLPNVAEDYVHRIGRTGRAGATGEAISLVSADEFKQLSDIERLIKRLLPRELIDGFEANHDVPASKLDLRPIRLKKPKKPKAKQADEAQSVQKKRHRPASKTKHRNGSRDNKTSDIKTEGRAAKSKFKKTAQASRTHSTKP